MSYTVKLGEEIATKKQSEDGRVFWDFSGLDETFYEGERLYTALDRIAELEQKKWDNDFEDHIVRKMNADKLLSIIHLCGLKPNTGVSIFCKATGKCIWINRLINTDVYTIDLIHDEPFWVTIQVVSLTWTVFRKDLYLNGVGSIPLMVHHEIDKAYKDPEGDD